MCFSQDVGSLLKLGRACVVLALWDVKRLLEAGAQRPSQKTMRAAARKALFFAVWANEQATACYTMLHAEVGVVRVGLEQAAVPRNVATDEDGSTQNQHTLIEEL